MWSYNPASYICHYGVKGMKWGIRRTPEELGHVRISNKKVMSTSRQDSLGDRDIQKLQNSGGYIDSGTKLYRITDSRNEKSGRKYVSFVPADKKYYEEEFTGSRDFVKKMHPDNKTGEQFQDEYTTTKKVKVAGQHQLLKAFNEELSANVTWPDQKISDVRKKWKIRNSLNGNISDTPEEVQATDRLVKKYGNVTYREMSKQLRLSDFNDFMIATNISGKNISLNKNKNLQDGVMDRLKKQGYDGVVDAEDVANGVVYPIVIFDDSKISKKTGHRAVN